MTRTLIIPAAGVGSRLGGALPKPLAPVLGRPMIDHLFGLYEAYVDQVVLVLRPDHEAGVREHLDRSGRHADVVLQPAPTGMLDAILLADAPMRRTGPASIWITWCDQVAVHPDTVRTLALSVEAAPEAAVVFPTTWRREPYIHLARNAAGEVVHILHRREGDVMPEIGESDSGLFALSRHAYFELLPGYARAVEQGTATRERNFLPFLPWLAGRAVVRTFACRDETESIGINTPDDLRAVEVYLAGRLSSGTGSGADGRP